MFASFRVAPGPLRTSLPRHHQVRPTERTNIYGSSLMVGDPSALEFDLAGDNRATHEGRSRTYSRIDAIVISAEQIRL